MTRKCLPACFVLWVGATLVAAEFVPPEQVQVHWDPELRVNFRESNGVFTYTYGAFVGPGDTFFLGEVQVFPTAPLTWTEPYDPGHEWVG